MPNQPSEVILWNFDDEREEIAHSLQEEEQEGEFVYQNPEAINESYLEER